MYEAEMSMTNQAMGQVNDRSIFAEFSYKPVRNESKSLDEGRDIYEEKPHIMMMIAGDRSSIINRQVREKDKSRFPQQWQAFESNNEQPIEGTLLSEWNGVNSSLAKELEFFGVKTVEALAAMSDTNVAKMMGGYALKQKAVDFLEDATLKAPYERLSAENEQLRNEIQAIKDQLNAKPKRSRKKSDG